MFKSLNTDWLKLALLRVFQSGWTVVILVGLSLLFCSFTGRQAFIVWWLTFSRCAVNRRERMARQSPVSSAAAW